jgi:hypothetical protein
MPTDDSNLMAESVTLEVLGRQFERAFAELATIRDEQSAIRGDPTVLTSITLRHDATLDGILDQLHALTAQQTGSTSGRGGLRNGPATP